MQTVVSVCATDHLAEDGEVLVVDFALNEVFAVGILFQTHLKLHCRTIVERIVLIKPQLSPRSVFCSSDDCIEK